MRNLKRALSLTLASVMLLGMMVVGTSALSFNDADKISNVTAASVLQDLGVMVGNDGNFMPEAPVSRAQMAIIICRMMYGNRLNVDSLSTEARFTDVAPGEYYTGYVNFAAQQGIIGGYGDGRFGPDDTVTTAQATLMLARGLGYYKAGEDQGDWSAVSLNAIALGTKLKMFGDLRLGTNALLSRDNVAEMTFNTMTKANPVQYSEFFKTYYTDMDSPMQGVQFDYTESLGYKNFGLVYKETTDDFGNKVVTWGTGIASSYNKNTDTLNGVVIDKRDEIITVVQGGTLTYTSDKTTKSADIAKDLKGYTVASGAKLTVNGDAGTAITNAATQIAAQTGDGYTVKVYTDKNNQISSISAIHEELAKIVNINNSKKEITVQTTSGNFVVDDDHIAYDKLAGKVANGDFVLAVVTPDGKTLTDAYVGDTVVGKVTRYTNKNAVTVDGKEYKPSWCDTVSDLNKLKDNQYTNVVDEATLYLDSNGYCIAISSKNPVSSENVCYVAYSANATGWAGAVEAYVYLPDGTKGVYTVNNLNRSTSFVAGNVGTNAVKAGLYVYSLDGNKINLRDDRDTLLVGNDYTVEPITSNIANVDHKVSSYAYDSGKTVYMNADTKFYIRDTSSDGVSWTSNDGNLTQSNVDKAIKTSTGLTSINEGTDLYSANGAQVAYRISGGNKIAIAVYSVQNTAVSASSKDLIFVTSNNYGQTQDAKWIASVIMPGENQVSEITVDAVPTVGLYSYKVDKDGVYSLTPESTANGAYMGELKRVKDVDAVFVGGVQLNKLSSAIVIDNTDDSKTSPTSETALDGATYFGYVAADSDKNALAVYICKEVEGKKTAAEAGVSGANSIKNDGTIGLDAGTVIIDSAANLNSASASGINDNFGTTAVIVYEVTEATKGQQITYTVKDASGRTVWSETGAGEGKATAGKYLFRVSLEGGNGTPGTTAASQYPWGWTKAWDDADGTGAKGTSAAPGVYSVEIKTASATLLSTSFVVE